MTWDTRCCYNLKISWMEKHSTISVSMAAIDRGYRLEVSKTCEQRKQFDPFGLDNIVPRSRVMNQSVCM